MKKSFSKGTLTLLQDAIDTAGVLGIERMVIDGHSLRGEAKENGTLILYPFPADTELDFGSIGIGRIPVLQSRWNLLGDDCELVPEFKSRDSGEHFVFRIVLKKNKTNLEFKCTDPAQIRAPKAFNDPDAFEFVFTAYDIDLMVRAKAAMQADRVTFSSKDGTSVQYSISATEGDTLVHELESDLDSKTPSTTFAVSYKPKILFPVLKSVLADAKEAPVSVLLTKRGILKLEINGIPSYIFPEA